MLVLKRQCGEVIRIGDDISVIILGAQGGRVKIGIDAPRHVPVDRKEIAERKRREGST